jgi:hypothetical protein
MKKFTTLFMIAIGLWLILCASVVKGQSGVTSVKGVLIDNNSKVLPDVLVSLFSVKDSTLISNSFTKTDGHYEFTNVEAGNYFISFIGMGYQKNSSKVFTISALQKHICDTIKLIPAINQLKSVEVTASGKTNFIETKMDKIIINTENSPSATGSTVFELLEKSPGVYTDKNGNLNMQGKNGVQVLIDGRATNMSGAEIANMLKNMPGSEVQSIEIINSPSARYDASGNAGIINIRTKKSMLLGTNGNFVSTAGFGNDPKMNGSLSLNNRTRKINVFGSYYYGYNKNERTLDIYRDATRNAVNTFFTENGFQYNENNNHRVKIGADYFLNRNSVIGVILNGYQVSENQHAVNSTIMSLQKGITDSSLNADNIIKQQFSNISGNLNYKGKLNKKGSELSADADYSNYDSRVNSLFRNYYYNENGGILKEPVTAKNNTHSIIDIKSVKTDFTQPVSASLKLEAGAKATWINTDNVLDFAALRSNAWKTDSSKSNRFTYQENVFAAFVNAEKQWKHTSIQAGIRAEYSHTLGNSITENRIVKNDYPDFFPSISVNQKIGAFHNIGFSYSRRIQRPDYESLNPFIYVIDEYTYLKGNPFLRPEYSNSYAITYLYRNQFMVQAGYTATHDVIAQVVLADTLTKALYQTSKNIDLQEVYRLTLSLPFQLTKWWKVNNNINGIESNYKSPNLQGELFNSSKFFVSLNINNSFKIGRDIKADLNCKYISPMIYGTMQLKSDFSLDAGISKSILHKKGSLKFAISDLLNTKVQNVSSVYPGVNYSLKQKYETRIFRLSFTYRFGNSNVKASRSKKTGLDEEQNRIKTGDQ